MKATIDVHIEGIRPLIMHNGQMADPLNKYSKQLKEITSKRKKVDADYERMAKIEWFAGIYENEAGKVCIPARVLEANLIEAAKKDKLGKDAKAAIGINEDNPLIFPDENVSIEELFAKEEYRYVVAVRIKMAKNMRTRPIFHKWGLRYKLDYDDSILNREQVLNMLTLAGTQIGLGDWRPKFGQFKIVSCL